jgi:CubicO group peptidase (beta-lactamase class C family)
MNITRRHLMAGMGSSSLAFSGARKSGNHASLARYYPSADAAGGWRTVKGRSEVRSVAALDTDRLDQAFAYAQTTSRYGGLVVVRRGYLAYERYFGRATREVTPNMASCGKMFTSACWGVLLHEIPASIPDQLEQKVFTERFLPEALPLRDPRKSDIKLGHLLAMTSGLAESNKNPGIVSEKDVKVETLPSDAGALDQDQSALQTPMWTQPGGGYFYSSQGVHVASIVLRHLAGMEMQKYIDQKLARPMQFGGWGYGMERADGTKLQHTPGGGGIALRATDMLRFGYLLLRNGYWEGHSSLPADYVRLCSSRSPYNPHSPFSLQFEINSDGHVAGAPRDAFFKSGAGGFCLYIGPSLDLVAYKMSCIGLPEPERYDLGFGAKTNDLDSSRDTWKPHPFDQFHDGPIDGDAGTRRTLEMIISSIV